MKSEKTTSKKSEPDRAYRSAPDKLLKKYLLDTSWRVALPILSLSFAGAGLDRAVDSRPAFTVLGLLAGSAGAWLMISKYLKKTFPKSEGAAQ